MYRPTAESVTLVHIKHQLPCYALYLIYFYEKKMSYEGFIFQYLLYELS